ncbi:MAG: hypothetical protein RIE06_31425 [Roseibium album]|uniref:hypothetical protein n=1 Tax=Roseibium album TaxID=311410 RepID=UPI0032EAC376
MKDFNGHATLLFGILVGLAFGIVVGMWSPDIGRPFWTDPDCAGPGWYCFAYSWQTLIAGSAALLGAGWTISKIQKQIELSHWQQATKEIDDLQKELSLVGNLRALISHDIDEAYGPRESMFRTTQFDINEAIGGLPSSAFYKKVEEFVSSIRLQSGGPQALERKLVLQVLLDDTIQRIDHRAANIAAQWEQCRQQLLRNIDEGSITNVPSKERQEFINATEGLAIEYKSLQQHLDEHGAFIGDRITTLAETYKLKV